jgi:hypothetical protein
MQNTTHAPPAQKSALENAAFIDGGFKHIHFGL